MNDLMSQDERRHREEKERKKAEVRARLEAQASNKAKKKGFMTGERKKKLRLLLRKKAAEELKRQQEAKAAERRRVIGERVGARPPIDSLAELAELRQFCQRLQDRLGKLEGDKWELEQAVGGRELEIHQLSGQVSDQRGKFVRPPLKRVPRYEQKIERMLLNARKEVGFTVTLKSVKRDQFKVEEARVQGEPEWSWKKAAAASVAGPAEPAPAPAPTPPLSAD